MSFYPVAGAGAATDPANVRLHLPTARPRRYPSDTSDAEWAVLAPLVPAGGPSGRGGRRPVHSRRDVVDAIRYVAHNGGVWRALPADFPPWQTVYDYYARWVADGTVNHIHNALREQVRAVEGRQTEPSAAIIDSQSVRAAETVARTSRGYDAGKRVNGRKLVGQIGFQVQPRRWVVERTLSWISRCRRTVRDYERLPAHHAAMVQWAMIIIMSRRLAGRRT
jgi:transposase